MTTTIPNISLRAIEPEDLDLLYTLENDTDNWLNSATNVPYSRYVLHDFVARQSGDIFTDKQVRLIIEDTDGTVIGLVDLVNFDARHQRAEVGIVISKPYRHQGFATAALQALHDYARCVVHLHQLYGVIAETNEASLRLFRRLGYKSSCQLCDWLYDGTSYLSAVVMQKVLV